jgi:hypothetical protein
MDPFYQSLEEFTKIDLRLVPMLLETVYNEKDKGKDCIAWLSEIDKAISIHKQISPIYYSFPNWATFKQTRKALPPLDTLGTYDRFPLALQFLGYARDGIRNMYEKCGQYMKFSQTYLDHTYNLRVEDAIKNILIFHGLLNQQFEWYRTGTSILPKLVSRPPPVNLPTDKFWGGGRRTKHRRHRRHRKTKRSRKTRAYRKRFRR